MKNATCLKELKAAENESLDSIILISSYLLSKRNEDVLAELLSHSVRVLKKTGILMIQGTPDKLPEVVQPLMRSMFFKYWVAIESETVESKSGLPTRHAALVIFSKSRNSFEINKVRFPHQYCSFCNQTLKDWGGKSHLRNPIGYVISDVWKDLPKINNYTRLSLPALQVALHLIIDADNKGKRCFILPYEGISFTAEDSLQPVLSGFKPNFHNFTKINSTDERHLDIVHNGDAVEILKKYPDNSIDLVFADPPYNLDKFYNTYNDGKEELKYIEWCNSWLSEYVRVLKPTGSLYLLNLPKWAVHHASFLNKHLYFQNWIVWDAVSEPRGKIMPAHYSLLFYTKHPTKFTFNYNALSPLNTPSFCLRSSCIKKRKAQGIDPKLPLTDI
ncbi:MAG: DNA methyltransferase, partial [Thermodesulfovibrionales bacterium]|nr:DNA methyltransferase [Thermodesulfovibrionales bacterium]